MTTNTEGLTLTAIRSLINHAIDETRLASPYPKPSPGEFVHRIITTLYTRVPRHRRLLILQDQVAWEEKFGKEHQWGVGQD